MNRGTEDLKNLLRVFENMTVEEYEALYEEAVQYSNNMDVVCPKIITDDSCLKSSTKVNHSKTRFFIDVNPEMKYTRQVENEKFEIGLMCTGDDEWKEERALAA